MTKPAPQKLGGRIIVIAVLLLMKGLLIQGQTGVVMQSSFETTNMKTGFQVQEGCCSYSLAQSSTQKRTGSTSMRVELRKSDPEAQYGNKRAELTYNNFNSESSINANIRWYAWSNFFPSATCAVDPAEEIFSQWHDKSPNCSTSPPLAFEMKNGRYRVVIRYSTTAYCSNPNYVVQYIDLGPIGYDKWNDWVVNYNPQYNSSGFVKIWLNGKLVVNYSGPCHYNGSWFPYWKLGIYKWLWMGSGSSSTTTQRVYYVDDVKTGDNTASESTFVSGGTTTPTNVSPTANAGADQFITLPTNSVTLNGANSTDPDGAIATYKWSQVSGPNTASISNSAVSSTVASNLVVGTYVFRLTVTDDQGATATNDITISVASSTSVANQAPVVNAGSNKSITLPTNSTGLSGSATDADGTISSYKWTQASGPNTASFSASTSASCTVSNMVAGTYSFKLTVTDNKAATASSTVSVSVNAATTANQAPVANAGSAKTITLPTNSTGLSGSGTDADGSIASYKWSQVSGPNTASFSGTTTAAVTVSSLIAGTYSFRLTVTDNKGAASSANVSVTVNAATTANKAPVANAGSAKTITLPTNSTSLSGSGTDADGSISSYKWSQVSGPNTATFSSTTAASITVSNLVAGTYSFRLTVTDNKGAAASANVSVTVNAATTTNKAPIANAGAPKTITLPVNSVQLSSASYDPDGKIAVYAWSQVSGPNTATFNNKASSMPTVSNLVAGVYSFKLAITDDKGATASATTTVTVNKAAVAPLKLAPIAKTVGKQTLIGSSVTLNGADSYDPDGTITAYSWTQTSGPTSASLADADKSTATASRLATGTYVFQLEVIDNDGMKGTATLTLEVTNNVGETAPVARAGNDQTIFLPASAASLDGSGSSDPNGTIQTYAWTVLTGPGTPALGTASQAKTDVSGLVEGSYTIKLTVTDNDGQTDADTIAITLKKSPVNIAPVAMTNDDIDISLPVDSVLLDGSQSYDTDGKITLYQWKMISGANSARIVNGNSAVTKVTRLKAGVYVFELTVKDDRGALSTKDITVTVRDANGNANASTMKTYPNPVRSTMTLRLDDATAGKAVVRIYSISGIVVLTDEIQKDSTTFMKVYDLSNLPGSSYVISVQFDGQPAITSKIQKL